MVASYTGRRTIKKGYSTHVRTKNAGKWGTDVGGFSRRVENLGSGRKRITYTQRVQSRAGQGRKNMARAQDIHNYGAVNNNTHNVRAHAIPDVLNGSGGKTNLTMTTNNANKLDTFSEHKMRNYMKRTLPNTYDLKVVEEFNGQGQRVQKDSFLRRKNSAQELHVTTKSNTG